jgi:hypothetical protein
MPSKPELLLVNFVCTEAFLLLLKKSSKQVAIDTAELILKNTRKKVTQFINNEAF